MRRPVAYSKRQDAASTLPLRPRDASARLPRLLSPTKTSAVAVRLCRTDRLADLILHLLNAVADRGRPFELQRFGRGEHLYFQLGNILVSDILGLFAPADGGIGGGMRGGFGLDACMDR